VTGAEPSATLVQQLERLAAAGIRILPAGAIPNHIVLERDGFVALVRRSEEGFGGLGAPGLLTSRGIAMLVWEGEQAFFVSRQSRQPAEPEQVAALRRFSADLAGALES
jgi:hypothetical protein